MSFLDKNLSPIEGEPILFSHIVDNPRQYGYSFHTHSFVEIYLFVRGDVDFILKDRYVNLHSGDVLIIGENAVHRPIIKSAALYERYFFGIPKTAFDCMRPGQMPFASLNNDCRLISSSGEIKDRITALFGRIGELLEQPDFHSEYYAFSFLLQLLYTLDKAANIGNADSTETMPPKAVRDALAFLEENSSGVNSVGEIADALHLNRSYLSTLFSETTHVSLKQYLTAKKISDAKRMLTTGATISSIAYDLGFATSSHFIAVFKKITGQTPGEYRRNAEKIEMSVM